MDLEREKQLRELKELLDSPGWKQFQEVVKEEIVGACERWISGSEDIVASKGYVVGLRTCLGLLEDKIGELSGTTKE